MKSNKNKKKNQASKLCLQCDLNYLKPILKTYRKNSKDYRNKLMSEFYFYFYLFWDFSKLFEVSR